VNAEERLLVEGVEGLEVAGKSFEVVVACWIFRGSRLEVIEVFRD
jgi:hypothetical protein